MSDLPMTSKEMQYRKLRDMRKNPRYLESMTKDMRQNKRNKAIKTKDKMPTVGELCTGNIPSHGPKFIFKHFKQLTHVDWQNLVKITHFNALEVALMLEIFICLTKKNSDPAKMTQYLEHQVLRQFFTDTLMMTNTDALCYIIGLMSDGAMHTSPVAFVKNFSIILRGDLREKAEFVFRTFDRDQNGIISRAVEMNQLLAGSFDINIAAENPSGDPEQPLRETIDYLLKKFDHSGRGEITFDNFFEAIKKEPLLMEFCFSVFPSESITNTFQKVYLSGKTPKPFSFV